MKKIAIALMLSATMLCCACGKIVGRSEPPEKPEITTVTEHEEVKLKLVPLTETITVVTTTVTTTTASVTSTTTATTAPVTGIVPLANTVTESETTAPATTETVPITTTVTTAFVPDVTQAPAPTYTESYPVECSYQESYTINNCSYQYSEEKTVLDYKLYYDYWIDDTGYVHFIQNGIETYSLPYQDFVLICNCVAYEYGNADYVPYYERSLVVEVIMNRYRDWGYNSIYDVITDTNAFTNSWEYADMIDFLPQVDENVFDAVGVYFCNYSDPNCYNENYYYYWGDGIWNYFSVEWHGLWLPPEDM